MIVLLGSRRPAKVNGAREALTAIAAVDARFADPVVHSIDLTHLAPRQPLSEAEIIDGARCRASALVEHAAFVRGSSLAVGLEGGLHAIAIDGERCWTLHTWAAVTDGTRWGYGAGGALPIPETLMPRVLAGEELGDVMDALAGTSVRGAQGAWGVLTRDLVGRKDAFRLAVIAACAPFYNRALYDRSR